MSYTRELRWIAFGNLYLIYCAKFRQVMVCKFLQSFVFIVYKSYVVELNLNAHIYVRIDTFDNLSPACDVCSVEEGTGDTTEDDL